MEYLPASELTDDEYERHHLLDVYNPEPLEETDPYYLEVSQAHTEIANIKLRLGKKARVAGLYLQGLSRKEIAAATNLAYATVCNALKNKDVHRVMSLLQRVNALESGPQLASKAALLWRIALREEHKAPRVSIAAVDILNKQQGVYLPETDHDTGLVVKINNFTINQSVEQKPQEKDITPTAAGGFTPITVDVDA